VYIKNNKEINSYSNQYILKQFLQNYPHYIPINWFQEEFYLTTNINIFDTAFNTDKKFCILAHKNIEVLIIRSDLVDLKKELIIKQFLNLKKFTIKRENIASQKYYYKKYKSFLNMCNFHE
jgi:hypothetical protein